jgi:hypothetical protein
MFELGCSSCLVCTLQQVIALLLDWPPNTSDLHEEIFTLTVAGPSNYHTFPPGNVFSVRAPKVSPSLGILSISKTRSALTEPTTTRGFCSFIEFVEAWQSARQFSVCCVRCRHAKVEGLNNQEAA